MLAGPADVLLVFNLTESGLLSLPPYNFNPGQVGYTNFAFAVGGLIGVVTAGPFSDCTYCIFPCSSSPRVPSLLRSFEFHVPFLPRTPLTRSSDPNPGIAKRSTLRNGGVREAEMRLPALLPYILITILCHIFGAFSYTQRWPWPSIITLSYGFSGLSVCSVPTIAIAYAIDCYKPISGEIMVVATVLKNVLGFGLSYWVFEVEARQGWTGVYMTQFAITMLPVVCTVPLYFWGKRLRAWTRGSELHRMEEMI